MYLMVAYSDALINYSEGFIRRGLLGEIIFSIHKVTNLDIQKFIAYIFVFTIINIFCIILILKVFQISVLYIYFYFLTLCYYFSFE